MQRRRDQFLNETGCVITQSAPSVTPTAEGLISLADTTIDVRRIAWINGGAYSLLWREDIFSLNSFLTSWKQGNGNPKAYGITTTAPLTVQLAPIPNTTNTLDLLTVKTGATLDGSGVLLGIPDDLSWIVKWGMLADLLRKDGPARDPSRAKYCETRWAQGIAAVKSAMAVIDSFVADQPIQTESVFDLDVYRASWQNSTPAQPNLAALAGLNLVAMSPVPNTSYTVLFDLLRNMPVPVGDGDYIQIGREMWDVVCNYAKHIALFKSAGAEFEATMADYEEFMRIAVEQNDRLRANEAFMGQLNDRSQLEEVQRPRLSSERSLRG
jgi:hypothetical protein